MLKRDGLVKNLDVGFIIMAFEYNTLKIDQKENGVWLLTINRPESLNALNSQVLAEIGEFVRQLGEMDFDTARCLVITGSGEKAFVAGADIKEMSDMSTEQSFVFAERGQSVFQELSLLKIPVIAAVNGFALGGGFELALACDFIICSENAKFGLPEVSLGLIPGFGGTQRLATAVGIRKARELIYSGEMISAQNAQSLGIVSEVAPGSELMNCVMKKVNMILTRAPIAIFESKRAINTGYDLPIDQGLKTEAEHFSQLFNSQDTREGISAFLAKRKPQFKGQ
jgi:enoyl-CoA hydratase